jgi:dolichol kinase
MSNNDRLLIRKSVHFLTGCLILLLSYFIERSTLLILFFTGGLFSFLTFKYKKFYLLHKTSDASLGTLFYPLGVISAFLVLYNQPLYYFRIAIMVLTISDTAAYFAGKIFRYNGNFVILCDRKSIHGVIAFSAAPLLFCWPVCRGN